jgi:hypothetical protein
MAASTEFLIENTLKSIDTNQVRRLRKRDVIASREYIIPETGEVVIVRLGKPRKRPYDTFFECAAELRQRERTWIRYMAGPDAFEALQLALMIIGTDLKHIHEQSGGQLVWLNATRTDVAFPTYPDYSLRDLMR